MKKSQEGINISTDIVKINKLREFNPKLIVGLTSADLETFLVTSLNKIVPLKEKLSIAIPEQNLYAHKTAIHSIQLIERDNKVMFLAEVSGVGALDGDDRVLPWIKKVIEIMQTSKIVNAFFPAYLISAKRNTQFLYGDSKQTEKPEVKKILGKDIIIARIEEHSKSILFATEKDLKIVLLDKAGECDWRSHCVTVFPSSERQCFQSWENIAFLGRFQNMEIPVTLESGDTFFFRFGANYFRDKKINAFGNIAAFIGEIGEGIVAVVEHDGNNNKGGILTLIPQSVLNAA